MFLISDWHYDKHHILQESVEPLAYSLFRQEYVHIVWAGADTQRDCQGPFERHGEVLTCCLFKSPVLAQHHWCENPCYHFHFFLFQQQHHPLN